MRGVSARMWKNQQSCRSQGDDSQVQIASSVPAGGQMAAAAAGAVRCLPVSIPHEEFRP
jgi:hypothetical protein